MNFFQSQDAARKNTKYLVFLFVMAVVILISLTNLLIILFTVFSQQPTITTTELKNQFDWEAFLLVGAGVVTVVVLASLYKIIQLSGGGESVAEMMGGELLIDGEGDIHKQRVLNIVEEMAIASGTPVPIIYLIEDNAINAFAAGTKPGNAVIGVTSGTIRKLNREQLQGVIAHEFSHIHNGDMRLNIRLIGILNGILIIGTIGYYILRSTSRSRHSRSSKNNGGGIIFLGLGLMIIGYSGTFFGNIIKAAVSRQREYLADASAVQFTRNKNGIAGALKRIGGNTSGSMLQAPGSSEISHMLFGQGISTFFSGLFSTHPPLEKRIRAIQPDWDGEFEIPPEIEPATAEETAKNKQAEIKDKIVTGATILAAHAAIDDAIDSIGQPTADNLHYAQQLIANIPEALKQAAHNPYTARALIYFLVLDNDSSIRDKQLEYLKEKADKGIYDETLKLSSQITELDNTYRLPLIEMTLSPLRQLSMRQYFMFKENLDALIRMDSKINLFEWSLQNIIFHHLDSANIKQKKHSQNMPLKKLNKECSILLSFLIHAGKQDAISPDSVFELAKEKLGLSDIKLIGIQSMGLDKLNAAMDKLKTVKPLLKPRLLKACAACITADKQITITEAELFRAVSDMLDCPMPPLIINN